MSQSQLPIRVLLIAPSLAIVGGQSVQAESLLSAFQHVPGIEIAFFPIDSRLPKPLRIPYLRTIVGLLSYIGRLAWSARKYQVLHIFTASLTAYALWTVPALLIGRVYRKKIIVHYHDGRAELHVTRSRIAKPTLAMADAIVSPSGYLVDVFAKYGIPARSIFNIIDVSRFRYRRRRNLRPIFLSNRGLEPLYNIPCTLRAFALIQKRYPDATLTIAHDGSCRPQLEKLAQELKLRNTQFIGTVPPARAPDLYDAADIYLSSSNLDCMPLSLLECFACGLPIVATKAGGIPYIVRDRESALLVDLDDHRALAACAIELLENPELTARLTGYGLRELEQYRPEAVRNEWIVLYTNLVRS